DVYNKINSKNFGADSYWSVPVTSDLSSPLTLIKTIKEIPPHTVFVFPHTWTFSSKQDASKHLASHKPLSTSVSDLLLSLRIPEAVAASNSTKNTLLTTQTIMLLLFRIAFQYQVYTPTANGKFEPSTYYYVSTDVDFHHVAYSTKPLFSCSVFVDLRSGQAYTLFVPPTEFTIPAETAVTRGALAPMPSFDSVGYWEHHYRSVAGDIKAYDWFLAWDSLWPILRNALGNAVDWRNSVAVNLGCGNSDAGGKMIKDGAAGYVLNIDVAPAGVAAASAISKSGAREDFLVMDATTLALKDGVVDWIFDKGTLDGILYHDTGVDMLKTIFANAERWFRDKSTGRYVLISLGSPENRMRLIEETIGGWEVEDAFQLSDNERKNTAKTAVEATMLRDHTRGGTVDTCYLYVCKKL
ncbi:hypothetical protein HK096_004961, partial [Nowakowskiella sp. JEL0078]